MINAPKTIARTFRLSSSSFSRALFVSSPVHNERMAPFVRMCSG